MLRSNVYCDNVSKRQFVLLVVAVQFENDSIKTRNCQRETAPPALTVTHHRLFVVRYCCNNVVVTIIPPFNSYADKKLLMLPIVGASRSHAYCQGGP